MMVLLTPTEVAQRTKLAVSTLAKRRVLGGGPPYTKLGGRVVYDAADVDAWIAAQGKRHSTSDAPVPAHGAA